MRFNGGMKQISLAQICSGFELSVQRTRKQVFLDDRTYAKTQVTVE
jgi:hypothetical protein